MGAAESWKAFTEMKKIAIIILASFLAVFVLWGTQTVKELRLSNDALSLEMSNQAQVISSQSMRIVDLENQLKWQEGQIGWQQEYLDWYRQICEQYEGRISDLEADLCKWGDRMNWPLVHGEVATAGVDSYREFGTVGELSEWLDQDPISDRQWLYRSYDCDDFAIDLTMSALKDGYWIGLAVTDNHMFNIAIIGNKIYRIEAERDGIEEWGELD